MAGRLNLSRLTVDNNTQLSSDAQRRSHCATAKAATTADIDHGGAAPFASCRLTTRPPGFLRT
jgi:hypothetical protein